MSHHHYQINELFSNADGTIQFIELTIGMFNGEDDWSGHTIRAAQGDERHTYGFPRDLPSQTTANTSVLLATQGFADLGLVTPDYIIPDGFLFQDGGTVTYASITSLTYAALPTDGKHSLSKDLTILESSPTNFAGQTAHVDLSALNDILGTNGADQIVGTSGDDRIDALDGNDRIDGGAGNDIILGDGGIDTALYAGSRSQYTIGTGGTSVSGGSSGTDTLAGIDRLQFGDVSVAFDFGESGAAARTARLLGAVFGPQAIDNRTYTGIGLDLFDQGYSYTTVADLAIHAALGFAIQDEALVTLLYTNVVGTAPTASQVAAFVALLDNGTYTQASLTTYAADQDLTATLVGLAQLEQAGLAYDPQ